jgi:hypothetical protein
MFYNLEPTIYRLFFRWPRGSRWHWRDFYDTEDRESYLNDIRSGISVYALQEGEDLEDPVGDDLPRGVEEEWA